MSLIDVEPGCRAGPVHQHTSEEEIFFVLAGSGLAWLDGAVHEIGAADTIVYLAGGPLHTVIAGPEGLSVLAYGENHEPALTRLPRAGMARRGDLWLELSPRRPARARGRRGPAGAARAHAAPAVHRRPGGRRARVRGGRRYRDQRARRRERRRLGAQRPAPQRRAARASSTARRTGTPREHELFVVLDGGGTLLLFDNGGELAEEHALRAGHCVSCPAGMRHAHALRAGDEGLTYLAYGTRDTSEIVYYPRSKKAWLSRVMVRLDVVDDYWEGEV